MANETRIVADIYLHGADGNVKEQQRKTKEEKIAKKKRDQRFDNYESTFNLAKNTVKQSVSYGWNRYTSIQEDYITSNTINNTMQVVNKGSSLVAGTMAGFSAGGPAGALIAVAGWGISSYMETKNEMLNLKKKLNEINYETDLGSSRLGLINNGRGTEN